MNPKKRFVRVRKQEVGYERQILADRETGVIICLPAPAMPAD